MTVVEALPLVEARVDAPATSVGPPQEEGAMEAASSPRGEASRLTRVTALKGQVLQWRLLFANAGRCPPLAPHPSQLCRLIPPLSRHPPSSSLCADVSLGVPKDCLSVCEDCV